MGILGYTREILDKAIEFSYCLGQKYGEMRKIFDGRRRAIIRSVRLNSEQIYKVDSFYRQNYGKRIRHDWHRLYQSFTGRFQAEYFPEILFSAKFEPMVNPRAYRYALDDKILLPLFCHNEENVRVPESIATFCNGVYYNAAHDTMSLDQLAEYLDNKGKLLIKPTQDTCAGREVRIVIFNGGFDEITNEPIKRILQIYSKKSFVIQKIVQPHLELKRLYPDAVNTFRIITYIWNGKVCHFPITLRLGQGGSYLDNAHAGGMFIYVSDEGILDSKAFTEFHKVYTEHPDTHVKYEGYKLAFVPVMLAAAKRMHLCTPQLGVISWDLTVDESGTIVLIEVNTRGQSIWFPQMASGKAAFGENTAEVLKYIKAR